MGAFMNPRRKVSQKKANDLSYLESIEIEWRPWQFIGMKISFLVVLAITIVMWSSTLYAPSAPEDFDRATQPLEVLRFVQKNEVLPVRRVGFGTVRVPAERLLTTVLLNVETWHPLSGGVVEDLEYDLSVLLKPDSSYSLLYFEEDSRKVAVCYQGRYRMYRLPEAAYETMVMTHAISSTMLTSELEALPVPLIDPLPEPFLRLGTLADGSRLFYRPANSPWPINVPWPTLVPRAHPVALGFDVYKDLNPIQSENPEELMNGVSDPFALAPGAIALKTPDGYWQLLALGMPSQPIISPDKMSVAWIDNQEFEVIGRPWVYRVDRLSLSQVMPVPFDLEPQDQYSAKQLMWQDDEHLVVVWGFGYGTVSQGGHVYRIQVPGLRSQLIYKAYDQNREEAVSVSPTSDGGIRAKVVRWVDDNFISAFYYNKKLEPLYPMGTSGGN